MHRHDRAVEVEQIGFVQPALGFAGDDARARLRRHRAQECRALWSVLQRRVVLEYFPAVPLHPELASNDAELAVGPHRHERERVAGSSGGPGTGVYRRSRIRVRALIREGVPLRAETIRSAAT